MNARDMAHHGNDATAAWRLTRDTSAAIRRTISRYVAGGLPLSDATLRCLVGMFETGEATAADFEEVGGESLLIAVYQHKQKLDDQRAKPCNE